MSGSLLLQCTGLTCYTWLADHWPRVSPMRRRKFIALLGSSAVAWPLAARAQATPVIGFVNIMSPESIPKWVTGFRQGLKEMGFVEGQNVAVEYRWAHGQYDRLPELVADLVRRKVTVLAATGGDPSPQVAKAATQTIPIVFTANGDPVSNGLVASLNRPGVMPPASPYLARPQ